MSGYQTYARTNIQTSDPRAVVVLLYEGSIQFLHQALAALDSGQREDMSVFILKTQKIVQFLTASLDFAEGGDIAVNLDRLYGYMRDTLSEANLKGDAAKIEEVIALLKPLLEAWRDVAQDPEAAKKLATRPNMYPPKVTMYPQDGAPIAESAAPGVAQDPEGTEAEALAHQTVAPVAAAPQSARGGGYALPKSPAAARAAYGIRHTG